ncbi:putative protein YqgN [Schaedlerella arabinosiphila]|nr:putative protein YqgN [Schaedlerella arabinosiphila]
MVKNMAAKKEIRARALKERRELPPEVKRSHDREILRLAAAHPFFQNAREIYCYASFRDEVPTAGLIEQAWRDKKLVAVPRVTDGLRMEFCYIESFRQLRPGYFGIPEPEAELLERAAADRDISQTLGTGLPETGEDDILMILPGAAFDRMGSRIGYGKGFYDRYLQDFPRCRRMGLAYMVQCVEEIPAREWDIRAEVVITEKGNFVTCKTNCRKTQ